MVVIPDAVFCGEKRVCSDAPPGPFCDFVLQFGKLARKPARMGSLLGWEGICIRWEACSEAEGKGVRQFGVLVPLVARVHVVREPPPEPWPKPAGREQPEGEGGCKASELAEETLMQVWTALESKTTGGRGCGAIAR